MDFWSHNTYSDHLTALQIHCFVYVKFIHVTLHTKDFFCISHMLQYLFIVLHISTLPIRTRFSQMHKICNNGHHCQLYSHIFTIPFLMLVNIKLDISRCNRITLKGCILHWSSSFLVAQLKRSWQY